MGFLETLRDRARAVGGHVVLVEGDDPRIVEAAETLRHENVARVTLLCPVEHQGPHHATLRSLGVTVTDPATDARRWRNSRQRTSTWS